MSYQDTLKLEEGDDIRPTISITTEATESSEDRNAMQMFETALLTAEDETDVRAARTVRAEAAAELAEFDENISLDELDNSVSCRFYFFSFLSKSKVLKLIIFSLFKHIAIYDC